MSEITVTTETVTRDGVEFVKTTWTAGVYRLVRTAVTGKVNVRFNVECDNWTAPSLHTLPMFGTDEIAYGVNWSAQGTKTPAEALAYAQAITEAAAAAEAFNQIVADA